MIRSWPSLLFKALLVGLLLLSSFVMAQAPADPKFCSEVLSDPRSLLIYKVQNDKEDPMGDLALWRSFTMKTMEKIPALFGNRRVLEKNDAIRKLPASEKEKILKCFHGTSYQLYLNNKNKLEATFPLLDEKDRGKILGLFSEVIDEQKEVKLKDATLSAERVLKNLDLLKNNSDLTCPEDLMGISSKVNPLKQKKFDDMFRDVICRTGVKPVVGEKHRWGNEFRKKHIIPPFSKLLVALATGDTSRIMPTMKEDDLMNWITDQKDRSITIHEMFEKSYLLNAGDVYKAFLTVENVLSENFHYGGDIRERLTMTKKLGKIINHTGGGFDLFGPWYHLYGMMLYGYAEGSGLKATVMGKIETGTSIFYKERNDHQENYMIAGGRIGARLKRKMKKIKTDEDFKAYCKDANKNVNLSDYLNLVD